MKGPFLVRSRLTAATNFSSASPTVTFNEFTNLDDLPPSYTARILGYSYNVGGTPNVCRLTLRPPFNFVPNLDDEIILRADTVNTFAELCGPGGLVVPRAFGIEAQDQQPPTTQVTTAATFGVFFETSAKDAAGTFMLWYQIVGEGD